MSKPQPGPIQVSYQYGELIGYFWVTPVGSKYQWLAGGNSGEEDSLTKAIDAARTWIKDNYANKKGD